MTENVISKTEGHAQFYAHLQSGKIKQAKIIGLDNERFVEKILLGRKYYEAPIIASRICGVCSVTHNITSVKAIEDACKIEVSDQIKNLRRLLLAGQMIQSHALHLYLLILPDFVGANSSFELQGTHPNLFANAIKLKHLADKIIETVAGRTVHPVSNVPGGFKHFPKISDLKKLLIISQEAEQIAYETLKLFLGFDYPDVQRKNIYSSLTLDKEYAFYDGVICDTTGNNWIPKNYHHYIYEELVPYNRAKFGTLKGYNMMVGAMARFNLNRHHFPKSFLSELKKLNITHEFNNPFNNIIAQAIENYYFIILANNLIEQFVKDKIIEESLVEPKDFGNGTSACEAPRGTLFHHYALDIEGYIIKADIITPTVQNLPSIEYDIKNLNQIIEGKNRDEINYLIKMLVRAYDPCITCATH